jgi:hypothetical protein
VSPGQVSRSCWSDNDDVPASGMTVRLDQGQSLRQDDKGHGHDPELVTCRPPLLPAPSPSPDVDEGDNDQCESTNDEDDVAPGSKHNRHPCRCTRQGHLTVCM